MLCLCETKNKQSAYDIHAPQIHDHTYFSSKTGNFAIFWQLGDSWSINIYWSILVDDLSTSNANSQ
jgi:hypothetical protein